MFIENEEIIIVSMNYILYEWNSITKYILNNVKICFKNSYSYFGIIYNWIAFDLDKIP